MSADDLVADLPRAPAARGDVDVAEALATHSRRLQQLIDDLLRLRDPAARRHGQHTTAPVDLDQLLRDVVGDVVGPDHDVRVWSSAGTVRLDVDRVRRIAAELLDNVVRHTPSGTRASICASHHDGVVRIVVEDDGPGIDPALGTSVTEPLVQSRHATTTSPPGLGIGLSLAAREAELHGGRVELTSAPEAGTRATVTLLTAAQVPLAA